MMKKILMICLLTCGVFLAQQTLAENYSVGGDNPDFSTIQGALNGSVSGDYIIINDGTYIEDLTINHNVTLTGNVNDYTAVIIEGKVAITKGTKAEITYLTIDAAGKPYAVQTRGMTIIKYGDIQNGFQGIIVKPVGILSMYGQIVQGATRNGIVSWKKGRIAVENSTIKNNGWAGVKVVKNKKKMRVADTTLENNHLGIVLKHSRTANNEIWRDTFDSNEIGIKYFSCVASEISNTFTDNTEDTVIIP